MITEVGGQSCNITDPKYANRAKDKLVSSEVATAVSTVAGDKLGQCLEQHAKEARSIMASCDAEVEAIDERG